MEEKYKLPRAEKYQIFGKYESYLVAYNYTDIGLSGETLRKANFNALKRMAETPECIVEEESFVELHAKNFLVSRLEYLLIHPEHPNLEAIAQAVGMLEEDYPILDEELYSSMIWEAVSDMWESADTRERIGYCESAWESVFASRRNEPTEKVREFMEGLV